MNRDEFKKLPLLGIVRGIQKDQADSLFQTSYEAGLRSIEITLNTKNALEILAQAVAQYGKRMNIGAGTVLHVKEAEDAVEIGAKFLVAPNFNKEIADFCIAKNIPYIPGAFTPSEVYTAWQASKFMIKIFPASLGGPVYFNNLKSPYDNIELMAVGGVTPDLVKDYFINGASAVAFGSNVYKKEWIEEEKWDDIGTLITEYIKNIPRT